MLAVLLLNRMNIMANRHRTKRREKLENSCKLASEANEDGYCRTCLGTEDLSPIFNEKQTEEKRTRELKVTTGLQVIKISFIAPADHLPGANRYRSSPTLSS